jgi:hypothetical protein
MDVDVCIGVLSGRFSFHMSNTFGNKHCIEIRHGCEVSGSANKFDRKKNNTRTTDLRSIKFTSKPLHISYFLLTCCLLSVFIIVP